MFSSAMMYRNVPDTRGADDAGDVVQPGVAVLDLLVERRGCRSSAASPGRTRREEWPREKKNPTDSGRLPSLTSLRVVLSMAAMWSASNACRMPEGVGQRAGPEPEDLVLVMW